MDRSVVERILKKIDVDNNGCWVFTGWNDGKGYCKISVSGKAQYVHRVMFQWFWRRKLRKGVQIDHKCCNRSCCNPLHLQAVMNKTNQRLKVKRSKK